jgi:hypothetical protein
MSNNNNRMIVFASILGAILATGILALNPSTITNAGAQMYGNQYGYDSNYYQDDNRYGYDNNHQKRSSHTDIQKIKCVNSNINVNGVDITKIPEDTTATTAAANEGTADAANTQNGNGLADKINFDRNLVNICVNVNHNEQVKVSTPEEEPGPCETCFTTHLTLAQQQFVLQNADNGDTFAEICEFLQENENTLEESRIVFDDIGSIPDITTDQQNALFNCLADSGVVDRQGS